MNLNGYESKILGRDLYLAIAKKNNLTTKKWTIGRYKQFKKEIKEAIENKVRL